MIEMSRNAKNLRSKSELPPRPAPTSQPETRKKGRKAFILSILKREPKPKSSATSSLEKSEEVKTHKWRINPTILSILIDVAIASIVAAIVVGSMTAYSQNWPPLVVIESGSMMHGSDSSIGTIDTGDLALVKRINDRSEITTYIKGRATGYTTYGDYGDVVVYSPPKNVRADPTPVIHRPLLWLEYNNSSGGSFDAPELSLLQYGVDWDTDSGSWYNIRNNITLKDVGYMHVDVNIELNNRDLAYSLLKQAHSGFITLGDNNNRWDTNNNRWIGVYDQRTATSKELVKTEWILGKAQGEIPWFGLLKLYVDGSITLRNPAPSTSLTLLVTTILLIILLPIVVDVSIMLLEKEAKKEEASNFVRENKRAKRRFYTKKGKEER
jgi:signal peptidase